MINYNFNTTAGASQSNNVKGLEGNKIHDVIFKGVEKLTLKEKYNVLQIKFANEEGMYTETIFEPNEKSLERSSRDDKNGNKVESPSGLESMMLLIRHLIDAVNPKLGEKIDAGTTPMNVAGWDNLCAFVKKATDPGIGSATKIKLIKNNQGYARFPYFARIRKDDNKAIVSNNFIGDSVFFSDYEMKQQEKQASAKPTPIASIGVDVADPFVGAANDASEAGMDLPDFDI